MAATQRARPVIEAEPTRQEWRAPRVGTLTPWRVSPTGRQAVRTVDALTVVVALVEDQPADPSRPYTATVVWPDGLREVGPRWSDLREALEWCAAWQDRMTGGGS